MTSSDIRIIIGGQEYTIEGSTLRPTESTFQSEVLRRLDNLEQEQKAQRETTRRIDEISTLIFCMMGAMSQMPLSDLKELISLINPGTTNHDV